MGVTLWYDIKGCGEVLFMDKRYIEKIVDRREQDVGFCE